MKSQRLFFLCSLVLLPLLAISQGSNERIFYSSFRPEGWDLFLVDEQARTANRWTEQAALEYNPTWSADGQWVVFTSERLGFPKLFIRAANGGKARLLLEHEASMQDQATLSPDGQWIVFTSTHEGQSDIYRLPFQPLDTLAVEEAINLTNDPGGDFRPAFAPDGQTIAFCSDRGHPIKTHPWFVFAMRRTGDIYTVHIDGSNLRRLTKGEEWEGSPTYSQDGQQIFYYGGPREAARIYAMDLNGDNQKALSPEGINALCPEVLDQHNLLFTANQGASFTLMKLNLESGAVDSIAPSTLNLLGAKVAPNGQIVCYGGEAPKETEQNQGGFAGDILVAGAPRTQVLGEQALDVYGVRRAFAAPPNPQNHTLIIDASKIGKLEDSFTPWLYVGMGILAIGVLLVVAGIFNLRKKKATWWAFLVFPIAALAGIAFLALQFSRGYMMNAQPISQFRVVMIFFALGFAAAAQMANRSEGKMAIPFRNVALIGLVGALYLMTVAPHLLFIPNTLYEVNYQTNEVKELKTIGNLPGYNPLNTRIIDSKYSHAGDKVLFSIGSFRGDEQTQGDVFAFDPETKELNPMTDSKANDGFGDVSLSGEQFVFRSGRSGSFDIYLQDGEIVTNLTDDEHRENFPVISADGQRVAFCTDRSGIDIAGKIKTMDIYWMEKGAEGTWGEPQQLTTANGQDAHPHFSPDGSWVIFTSEEAGINDEEPIIQPVIFGPQMYGEIFAIHLETGKKVRLTHNKWEEGAPLWYAAVPE